MENNTTETTAQNSSNGDKPEAVDVLTEARSLREGLEKSITELRQLKKEIQESASVIVMSGRSQAGQPIKTQEQLVEEKIKAEADRVVARFRK